MPPQSPFSLLLGIEVETCTPEEVVCRMRVTDAMANRNGVLHGGALMTLADVAAGSSAFINSPVKVGDTVTARCEPVHIGRITLVLQVGLTRGDGRIVGTTSQTHLFMGWRD